MNPDEMIAVIQAYKEGKKIQFRIINSKFLFQDIVGTPVFNFEKNEYRVRPAPVVYYDYVRVMPSTNGHTEEEYVDQMVKSSHGRLKKVKITVIEGVHTIAFVK